MDDMLTESAENVLAQCCTPQFVRTVEAARERGAGRDLWDQLDALGFLDALVPEDKGGSGLRLAATTGALFAFGAHALPLPAAHTMIARDLLARAGVEAPRGPIALALAHASRHGAAFVPYGLVADAIIVETADGVSLVSLAAAEVQAHGDSLDATLTWPAHAARALPSTVRGVAELGALATAATMAGAMQRVFDMTLGYVNERQQFGRSLGKFQAVQQQLSVMAEHVAATRVAAQLGCAGHGTSEQRLAAAIAKARASRAAPLVANGAHALTGAMGITAEFDLQLHTRRLHAQRLQYGSESYWDEVVGAHAIDRWSSVAAGVVGIFDALDEAVATAS
ncbi:acyl-CoA dehydrogenase [Paraburkholderia unamae]|uniref:acyl-CoA dehydrogenase family protein n=1 Tax=Paraburkholderia unamae TaxID=219649 RepID=UPI000DC2A2FF|nr:acyl-CoA dehydrogenase family protein [Paraburkholderia unamae]RAR51332.1 acyl-CoA dehydrogenase [Paraburkholderia unamae]